MPTTDYTEFLHNVKQEYITNSYELDGIFIFDIELPATSAYRTKSVCKNPYNTRYLLVL